jgi:hypothetical protein
MPNSEENEEEANLHTRQADEGIADPATESETGTKDGRVPADE